MPGLFEKANLMRGLLTREAAFEGPFAVTVDVTRRCNLKCVGCPCHSPDIEGRRRLDTSVQDLDYDMFLRLCAELKTMGTRTLVLSGDGEPFLHPRLFELLALSKDAGFRTVLMTNGTLLDQQKAQELARSRLDVLRVSLWATSPEEYERNQPGARGDTFAKVVEGVRLLVAAKHDQGSMLPCLTLHMVLNRSNFRSVGAYVDLAVETGADAVSFSPLHTIFDQLLRMELEPEEVAWLKAALLKAKESLRRSGIGHNVEETIERYEIGKAVRETVPCYVAWLHPRVKVDGTVQPCNPCGVAMGNINEQGMGEIWNGPDFRQFRRTITSPAPTPFVDEHCDCSYCCYVGESRRIHRLYKWVAPLARRPRG